MQVPANSQSRLLRVMKDVRSVLRSLSPQCLWASQTLECKLILFVTNRLPYLQGTSHFKFFFQQFPWVLQLWRFFIKWYWKEWSIKLCINNGGWHETLNLLHVSRCKILHVHFVTSYMRQNKSRKQTLESVQYGLEISFY